MKNFQVGLFLAYRQISRSSPWTSLLIIFVMTLTFLNLAVISGILVGLVEGSSIAFRSQYSGDVFIQPQPDNRTIKNSNELLSIARSLPEVVAASGRLLTPAAIRSDFKEKSGPNEKGDSVSAILAGIDTASEDSVTGLSSILAEGGYFDSGADKELLLGSNLLKQYASGAPGDTTLEDVIVGSEVLVTVGGKSHEFVIQGVIKSKVGDVSRRAFITEKEFRRLFSGNSEFNEIAIKLAEPALFVHVKDHLVSSGPDPSALIQTWKEAQGTFFKDISLTFSILGGLIGAIGIAVAAITLFMLIFINATSRRKYIGILKGIGIEGRAITISYLLQSVFYSASGVAVGLILLYGIFIPYFADNPIDFPFSDGILAISIQGVAVRAMLLTAFSIFAGFLPARLIIRKSALDSILGR